MPIPATECNQCYSHVQDLIRAGAGGMFLEDQVWPKRCGHMRGKQVIPLREQLNKLRAAVEAKGNEDFFIVGPHDSRQALGLDEAIKRGIAFKDAGATRCSSKLRSPKMRCARSQNRSKGHLVANMLERGGTPLMGPES
jgi:methylisocitrate lyase